MRTNRVREIDRQTSGSIIAEGQRAADFEHRTGRGDEREDLLKRELRARLGPTFGAEKAEIVDSDGKGTSEYDVAIFDATMLPALRETSGRRIVRAESLIATIEVKSHLDEDTFEQVDRSLDRMMQLHRFYHPGQALMMTLAGSSLIARSNPSSAAELAKSVETLRSGVNMIVDHKNIPAVFTTVFAYDGPTIETLKEYVHKHSMLLDAVCVLGRYTVYFKKETAMSAPDPVIWGEGQDAWGAFANLIDHAVVQHVESRVWVTPDVRRYYAPSAEDPVASGRIVDPKT